MNEQWWCAEHDRLLRKKHWYSRLTCPDGPRWCKGYWHNPPLKPGSDSV